MLAAGQEANMSRNLSIGIFAAAALVAIPTTATGAQGNPIPRVGVYDSRVVSYAYFWSPPVKHDREALVARAVAAKAAGDTALLKTLTAQIMAMQDKSMQEVFSTAPADEALAALGNQMPAILGDLGVASLVSKWDKSGLRGVPEEDRVDATDRLLRAFFAKPNGHLRQTVQGIEAAKPIPLWEAKLLCLVRSLVPENSGS
jgi:hypothetical protein